MANSSSNRSRGILDRLAADPVEIAIDTEFRGIHTLTIQAACRIASDTLAVQVYRSPAIPNPPKHFRDRDFLDQDRYSPFFSQLELRPTHRITLDLSPVHMIKDLFRLGDLGSCSRAEGVLLGEHWSADNGPANGIWNDGRGRWEVPTIALSINCHFLTADLLRMFGRDFLAGLLTNGPRGSPPITIAEGKLLNFADAAQKFAPPTVEFATLPDGSVYRVQLRMRDTMLPFGPGGLERHSRTFLGFGKAGSLSDHDKKNMLQTFLRNPQDAYAYAIADAVNTLLVAEQMRSEDRETHLSFGCPDDKIPKMKPTLGARVAQSLTLVVRNGPAIGSTELAKDAALKRLMSSGGAEQLVTGPRTSWFGQQTATVHGGLLFSRSSTQPWHEAPGMLRDVDMSSCYSSIIEQHDVYLGRPVVLEPGSRKTELQDAIALMERHSERDGWFVRVTGDLRSTPNTLIPSTVGATTPENFRKRRGRGRQPEEKGGAKLFSRRIESGVVTWATWLMIRALPAKPRGEYKRLRVDSIVFYPSQFIASSGSEFDQLRAKLQTRDFTWACRLDTRTWTIHEELKIGLDHASLRFPIRQTAQKIGKLRKKAQKRHGKGSGRDVALKIYANTMYGVLASPRLHTNNVVAANQITAQARAEAFALMMSLNGIQVITDGATYRRDQIPSCTFAECLRRQPDYPLRRAEQDSKIPFLNPATIPEDGPQFTKWYRQHVKQFFQVDNSDHDELFQTHAFEHKATGPNGSISFDALACDGSCNYVKCNRDAAGKLQVLGSAMRSYGPASQRELGAWIVETFPHDSMSSLPPITSDVILLKFKEAKRKVHVAFSKGINETVFPLGFELTRVCNFKVLKASAFIYQTPEQFRAIAKQFDKFSKKTSCGLELLALRRSYGARMVGSIQSLARQIYTLVQSGSKDLTKALNLNRPLAALEHVSSDRRDELESRRAAALKRLLKKMDASRAPHGHLLTGLILTPSTCPW